MDSPLGEAPARPSIRRPAVTEYRYVGSTMRTPHLLSAPPHLLSTCFFSMLASDNIWIRTGVPYEDNVGRAFVVYAPGPPPSSPFCAASWSPRRCPRRCSGPSARATRTT
eukprot:413098-Pyramimonas_sp.AAC.1